MRRNTSRLQLVTLEDRSVPAIMNFTLDTPNSKLSLGGDVDGNAITQQGANSLVTTYSGTVRVDADFSNNTIEFVNTGSSMKANNSGTWKPAVGGGAAFVPGSAPANYGGNVTVTVATVVAGRNLAAVFTSAPLPLAGGPAMSFPSTQTLVLTAGDVDYNNFLLQGTSSLGGNSGPNSAANGTFTDLGNGNYTLAMPGAAKIVEMITSTNKLTLNINGTLNATATLPVVDLNGAAAGTDTTFTQTAGGASALIAPSANITRNPAASLSSMTVVLGSTPDGMSESLGVDLSGTTLSTTGYDSGTNTLTITGANTLATYQSVLRKVTYTNANPAGTAGARAVMVSVNDGNNSSLIRTSTGSVTIANPASKVSSVKVNDGVSAQRSRVTSVKVAFDSIVSLPGTPSVAFQLARAKDNADIGLSVSVDNTGPGTVATLTFTSGPLESTSLSDGRYTLTVLASQVNSGNFDGGSGTGSNFVLVGDPSTNKFFRLFGDSNGDGTVIANDFADFGNAFNSSDFTFDFDNNNIINADDFAEFGNRFGMTI